jgi:hypothetical protein
VNSAWANLVARYRRLPQPTTPIVVIVLCVMFGNILFLIGFVNIDPISWTAGISRILCNVSCGRPMIDPNVGYLTQSLGHLSAMDILHGHLPFWNYYEGVGSPLAGEMQSAALFPLTVLFALPSGLLWFHMSLEIIAGVSTYFLARRLSLPIVIATGVGVLFALNGTFAWLGNAVLNPVAFMPMLVLGIEMIYDSAKSTSRKGWYVAAIALALSLYAGFPEVAYFDGLFCAGWAVLRFFSIPKEDRLVAARRLGLAAGIGLLLSLPILVPFYDFYKVANIGTHANSGYANVHLVAHGASMFIDPYVYGLIFANPNATQAWGTIGGYFTFSVVALGLLGLFGKKLRPVRIFLGLWAFIGTLSIFDILDLRKAWNILPLASSASLPRYLMPSCELALIILAGLGIMDFANDRRAKRLFTTTTAFTVLLLLWAALTASTWNDGLVHTHKTRLVYMALDSLPFIAAIVLLVLGRLSFLKIAPLLVTILVVGESIVMFQVPTAGAAKQINIDMAPIHYLQKHEGRERFLDLGILTANWGSEYNLNSLSAIDLPFPDTFAKLIDKQLYPNFPWPINQFVIHAGMSGIEAQEQEVVDHFTAYEDASVKYLVVPVSVDLSASLAKLGVTQVFGDSIVAIYKMPDPRPLFSTMSTSCTVKSTSDNDANVSCPSGSSTLVRAELYMAGWHASVNGKPVTITKSDVAYQSIPVPQGTSTVSFSFMPPHEKYAIPVSLLAGLFLLYSWVRERLPAKRPRHKR